MCLKAGYMKAICPTTLIGNKIEVRDILPEIPNTLYIVTTQRKESISKQLCIPCGDIKFLFNTWSRKWVLSWSHIPQVYEITFSNAEKQIKPSNIHCFFAMDSNEITKLSCVGPQGNKHLIGSINLLDFHI